MLKVRDLGTNELLVEVFQTDLNKWCEKNAYEISMILKENGIWVAYVTDMLANAEDEEVWL